MIPITSLTDYQDRLFSAFKITAADLDQNKHGILSEHQRQLFQTKSGQRYRILLGLSIFFSLLFCGGTYDVWIAHPRADLVEQTFLTALYFLPVFAITLFTIGLKRQNKQNQQATNEVVEVIEAPASVAPPRGRRFYPTVFVGPEKIAIQFTGTRAFLFVDQLPYRFYIYNSEVIAVEALRAPANIPEPQSLLKQVVIGGIIIYILSQFVEHRSIPWFMFFFSR